MAKNFYQKAHDIYDAEVIESSAVDSNLVLEILIKAGRTMCLSEAELYDSDNNLVAVAQVNYIKIN